jgi:hypothetical protein
MSTTTGGALKLMASALAFLGFLTTESPAQAQDWYYINGAPASLDVAQRMANRGLPFGNYWLQPNGNWGFGGDADVQGNIYGRHPSLSERGLLF